MFCRVLDNPQAAKRNATQQRARIDQQMMAADRVKELEHRQLIQNVQTHFSNQTRTDEMERLALMDSLTELFNSRTLVRELKEEMKRARRYKRPISLIMLSVDGLRDVTKRYGPLSADAVLKVVANIVRECIRDVDVAARYSGDEFAILLPETNAAGAAVVAERIRQRISSQAVTHNWNNLKVTASIGLASFPAHAREHDELLARTAQALEMAVQRGGDRVCSV